MAEYRGAGADFHRLAVPLHRHAEGAQVDAFEVGHLTAGDVAGRRGVVGHHADQVELEVLVARGDHLDGGDHVIDRRNHLAYVAARAAQRRLGDHGDFRLDLRVDQLGAVHATAVRHAEVVGEEAVDRRLHAHLRHLRPGSQAPLQADGLVAAGFLAPTDLPLDVVGGGEGHRRVVVGDRNVVDVQLSVFDVLGEGQYLVAGQGTVAVTVWGWRALAMSRARSAIMPSSPPTVPRRPSSTSMSRTGTPYIFSARWANSRNELYTPA